MFEKKANAYQMLKDDAALENYVSKLQKKYFWRDRAVGDSSLFVFLANLFLM